MASTRTKRGDPSRNLKRETDNIDDEQAQDDALELAERKLQQRKQLQAKSVPHKGQRNQSHSSEADEQDDDESMEADSYDSEEMGSFIVDDEEIEAEQLKQLEEERQKKDKRRRRKRPEQAPQLDEEDIELVRENFGQVEPAKQKKRLRRNEDIKMKNEEEQEVFQIDTSSRPQAHKTSETDARTTKAEHEIKTTDEELGYRKPLNNDHLQKARNIFGDTKQVKQQPDQTSKVTNLKEFFNTDEIDDPFSTDADRQIAEKDIPERLQVRIADRLDQSQQTSFYASEAEWILERLATLDSDKRYGNILNAKDIREKVCKVLKMIRSDHYDVPMICKYRKYEYAIELDEDAVWHIYNLDQEYGRFVKSKSQVEDFLKKLIKFDHKVISYIDELQYAKSQSELNNFNALIRHLRFNFSEQLNRAEEEAGSGHKQPQVRDEVQISRMGKVQEFSRLCFLGYGQFQENLNKRQMNHLPPEPRDAPSTVAAHFMSKVFSEETELLQAACKYAAVELSAQPQLRNMMKNQLREHGTISVVLTEQGRKDLDIYHHSYRVKLVENRPLRELQNSDLFLDILQCEKSNLITTTIEISGVKYQDFRNFLEEHYLDVSHRELSWNKLRAHVIKTLLDDILLKELVKEVRSELQVEAENVVISNCKKAYTELLMYGPFNKMLAPEDPSEAQEVPSISNQKLKKQEEIIKAKERLVVMAALMHQIDANNFMVTIAVVDKYGELIAHKDFMRLLPPRKRKPRQQTGQPEQQLTGGGELPKTEEELEHERDCNKLIDILDQHSVDLIVVAANSLEARTLKNQMFDLSEKSKARKKQQIYEQASKRQGPAPIPKEACVIWGSTEVPKLFALSHNSQKLHKGVQQILKQAISMARFEQDPMVEILNLWSPIVAENQALALVLDPMQKLVNQSRLADGLEEVNIKVVNKVGVNLNVVIDHEHMHSVIQFLSGLGPRMAKRLLTKFKQLGSKLSTRGEMLKKELVPFKIYFSLVPFVLIRIPDEEQGRNKISKVDILDQTRIHHEHYKLAMKIAADACYGSDGVAENQEVDKTDQILKCKEVIARPSQLKNLNLKQYYEQLDMTNQGNMRSSIDLIIQEFKAPFADPRQARNLKNPGISNERLFYMLIDESKRTFKRGLVVTGTVSAVLEQRVICKLENGLTATIVKEKLLDADSNEKLKDTLDINYVITGRIERILTDEGEQRFEVQLSCKKGDMISHERYLKELAESIGVDPRTIREEDKKNLNFVDDPKPKNQGRFQPRRIAYEKFKNISSRRALAELESAEVGEFVFRPSTRSPDALTLTWKFWRKHYAHIEIHEVDKQSGDAIGKRLMISNESFENLREIVERYIIPCNRLVKEVTHSAKWCDSDRWEDLEQILREEKNSDKGRIPYRFAILPQYHQHIVLAYIPRNEVIKEFIKVRPRGFYFHEQNLVPFVNLINWFKENWQNKDYQKFLRRQKSPRTIAQSISQQIKETPGEDEPYNQFGQNQSGGHQWQMQGGNSVYSNQGMKQEPQTRSYGRGSRNPPRDGQSPGHRMKYESGGRSPAAWTQERQYDNDVQMRDAYHQPERRDERPRGGNTCYRCGESGHFAKECPQPDQRQAAGGQRRGCFNCGEDGHISRDCPQERREKRSNLDQGGFKRQRIGETSSLKRNADGGYDLTANWTNDGWNAQQQNRTWEDQN